MPKHVIISAVLSLLLIGGALYTVSREPAPTDSKELSQNQNIEIKDGVQYVTITARGGYYPRLTKAQGGIPTKLIIKTNNTYDCSAALVVRSVGFKKILQPNGEEVIDLGVLKSGETIQGVCGMGMYNFQIQVG